MKRRELERDDRVHHVTENWDAIVLGVADEPGHVRVRSDGGYVGSYPIDDFVTHGERRRALARS